MEFINFSRLKFRASFTNIINYDKNDLKRSPVLWYVVDTYPLTAGDNISAAVNPTMSVSSQFWMSVTEVK